MEVLTTRTCTEMHKRVALPQRRVAMRIETETPAVCDNKECSDYQAFEMYDFEEVEDTRGEAYVICRECGNKIFIQ